MRKYEYHEAAFLFPLMEGAEYESFKEDMRANGQLESIKTLGGKVVDGRNRLRVCTELKLEPVVEELPEGTDPDSYVVSRNLRRRHLTGEQRKEVALKLRRKGWSYRRIGEELGTGKETIRRDVADEAGGPNGPPGFPETVTGKDGKQYPARRPKPAAPPAEDIPDVEDEVDYEGEVEEDVTNVAVDDVVDEDVAVDEEEPAGPPVKVTEAGTPVDEVLRQRAERERRRMKDLEDRAGDAPDDDDRWCVTLGDSKDAKTLREVAEPRSVRLCFMDPPYNIGVAYEEGEEADDLLPPEEYVAGLAGLFRGLRSRLTADGSVWVLISDEYVAELAVALKETGYHRRSWVIWYESFGVQTEMMFARTKRHLLYYVLDKDNFYFDREAALVPSARQLKYDDLRAAEEGRVMPDVWTGISRLTGTSSERVPGVPTQIPVALVARVLSIASEPGDLVLDPFSGSGTTGVACLRQDRRYLGIEKRMNVAELSRLRLRAEGVR